jgi:Tol biopolymer transport system component
MIGTTLNHYDITRQLGSGGMGDVYQAIDRRLDRNVAIKVLPDTVARDTERIGRFTREARVLASLNHPHIAAIYGIEQADTRLFLVMELVTGETLSERLARGPVPLDTALRIARQIAAALDAAHERGIVHRDLKPANVMVSSDGTVKLLDFGLAKRDRTEVPALDAGRATTIAATPITEAGLILGTPAYMAPEQARGEEIDKRADIWAFGVLLFEMVTGRRLFQGRTATDTIAAVVRDAPDLDTAPVKVRRLIGRCLEKDPKQRLRDIGDAWELLEEPVIRRSSFLPGMIAAASVLVAATVLAMDPRDREGTVAPGIVRTDLVAPAGTSASDIAPPAISPDGRSIAFVASGRDGRTIYVRQFDSSSAVSVAGTSGARGVFWSADGGSLGFTTDAGLFSVAAAGGTPRALYRGSLGFWNGAWNADGDVLFVPTGSGVPAIHRVSSEGGAVTAVTHLDSGREEVGHRFPVFLSDGRRFLCLAIRKDSGTSVVMGTLGSTDRRTVLEGTSAVVYTQDSDSRAYLLYARDRRLFAQRFNEASGEVDGVPRIIAQSVAGLGFGGLLRNVAASRTGVIAYAVEPTVSAALAWFDRRGTRVADLPNEWSGTEPALSSDGRYLAVVRNDPNTQSAAVWVTDLKRGVSSRLSSRRAHEASPVWSVDGSAVAFHTHDDGVGLEIRRQAIDGRGADTLLTRARGALLDWTSDGRHLLMVERGRLSLIEIDGGASESPAKTDLVAAGSSQTKLSPDGKFLAFTSGESGRAEVHVMALPAATGRWQVSSAGGFQPAWWAAFP